MKRLVLLGGGHAHVQVLQRLARHRPPQTQVVLISPAARALYSGMLPGWVAGHYRLEQLQIDLPALARAAGAEWAEGRAVALDAAQRSVTLADGRVAEYDLLSLNTGSEPRRDAIPGAREHALFVRPLEPFVPLMQRLLELSHGRRLQIGVIGGGAAGFELVCALAYRLKREAGTADHRLSLITGPLAALAGYPPAVVRRARSALAALGVSVIEQACCAIESDRLHLADGATLACDAPVVVTGASAPGWLAGSGLTLDAEGFVATNASLQSASHLDVFAAGDVASRQDVQHPRSGVHAVRAGPVLAENLLRALGGTPLQEHQPPRRTLNLLSCGDRRAIAHWGGWSAEGAWVWRWKDHIDRNFVAGLAVT
jgi:pyridine nucleotide-disulfide oxidoreductase family protein